MKIDLKEVTVKELTTGFEDNEEMGVVAYSGKLDVRPPYQREFIYGGKERDAVIQTLSREFPLNVLYWAVREKGDFEVIDGQQRTISICQFVEGEFALQIFGREEKRYFHNLQEDEKVRILGYKLMVYLCSGTDSEKLDWFRTINITGMKLTEQELRNAVYAGSWVGDAKRYFSKSACPAYGMAADYLKGSPIRQDYLETVIEWISGGDIEGYMANKQHKPNANELWLYFQKVINWVEVTFPNYRSPMKTVAWGKLYNQFGEEELDAAALEGRVSTLMQDEDVGRKKGIYSYVLDDKERHLNIRQFSPNMRREAFEGQKGKCPDCGKVFTIEEMEADHITPWHEGGKTTANNCQMLCKEDNRRKSGK
jgi:hypothetical protein